MTLPSIWANDWTLPLYTCSVRAHRNNRQNRLTVAIQATERRLWKRNSDLKESLIAGVDADGKIVVVNALQAPRLILSIGYILSPSTRRGSGSGRINMKRCVWFAEFPHKRSRQRLNPFLNAFQQVDDSLEYARKLNSP